jgi:carbon monoxide dehydrogenase subunit G
MEMKGEQLISAPQKTVWNALNDPETLKACVPGCESIELAGENTYTVLMVARVGPVAAKFKGKLTLSDIKPPDSYALSFEGQGGAAGFAKGSAQVRLEPQGLLTKLAYDVKANVGGKLAQIGSRLVDAAAKKVADDFFKNFNEKIGSQEADEEATVIGVHVPPKKEEKDEGHKAAPPIRDEDLPKATDTTVAFFAASSLVVFIVALFAIFG